MQCVIQSQNMKILVRGLHSLSRIGDDLYVESNEDGLCFRTVNAAQSAYSSLVFHTAFFVNYKSEFKTDEGGKCKLSMKSCLSVFKTPHSMDRNVESCKIAIDEDCVKVSFQIQFMQGYTKNFYLAVADNANVQLKYNKDEMCNKMDILSKKLYGFIKHFRTNDEEITLSVKPDRASLRNYFPHAEADSQKVVRTNLSLQPSEFVSYDVNQPASITFALRELRAVCTFSEQSISPVGIYFERPGKPVIFSIRNDQLYEADYVVSTLPPEMISGERPHRRSQLSDVVSSVPSTTTGLTGSKKRKLAPVTEEVEPASSSGPRRKISDLASVPRVSLVDIIKHREGSGQSSAPRSVHNEEVRPAGTNGTNTPPAAAVIQIGGEASIQNVPDTEPESVPDAAVAAVTASEPSLNAEDFFSDDINNECLQMACNQIDEMTQSQKDRVHTVFQFCYDYRYSAVSNNVGQILCKSSDIDSDS